ncbi:F0F1 ATP synthase subunit delta [Paenibacillus sp. P26]|nr:F0F1 ATP synthase subunit delta [Paenibacillus sp. P26]
MSQDTTAAKRYAKALFEVAKEQNRVAEVEQELKAVIGALKEHEDLFKLIKHPSIESSAKTEMLKRIFESAVSQPVFNTLKLLIDRRREDVLEAFVEYYVNIANEALGQASATVYSPATLSESELSRIGATFSQLTGKQIRVESVIDKSLLGGIQVRIGDRLYDGDLSGKLARLQKQLNQSQAL